MIIHEYSLSVNSEFTKISLTKIAEHVYKLKISEIESTYHSYDTAHYTLLKFISDFISVNRGKSISVLSWVS